MARPKLDLKTQFGLIKRAPVAASTARVFSLDEEDEEDELAGERRVNRELLSAQRQQKQDRKAAEQQAKLLEEDPTVYDYDGVYDAIQAERRRGQPKKDVKPKYIAQLMDKAEERKREDDRVFDRKLAKERAVDEELYVDKEKFVTAAYKEKLIEKKKWEALEAARAEKEAREDVIKRGNLRHFYQNLLSRNVAYGSGRFDVTHVDGQEEPDPDSDPDLNPNPDQAAKATTPTPIATNTTPSTTKRPRTTSTTTEEDETARKRPVPGQALPKERRNDDAAVSAARERFLKRKAEMAAKAAHAAEV